MSKNNHNVHREMQQRIRDQQREIGRLHKKNGEMRQWIDAMRKGNQERLIGMMNCVYALCVDEIITEEQAGSLMLSLVGVWHNA